MKKIFTILGMTILGCLCFTACNSSKVENKSDEVVITQNKSICDGIMVAKMKMSMEKYFIMITNQKKKFMPAVRQTAIIK